MKFGIFKFFLGEANCQSQFKRTPTLFCLFFSRFFFAFISMSAEESVAECVAESILDDDDDGAEHDQEDGSVYDVPYDGYYDYSRRLQNQQKKRRERFKEKKNKRLQKLVAKGLQGETMLNSQRALAELLAHVTPDLHGEKMKIISLKAETRVHFKTCRFSFQLEKMEQVLKDAPVDVSSDAHDDETEVDLMTKMFLYTVRLQIGSRMTKCDIIGRLLVNLTEFGQAALAVNQMSMAGLALIVHMTLKNMLKNMQATMGDVSWFTLGDFQTRTSVNTAGKARLQLFFEINAN